MVLRPLSPPRSSPVSAVESPCEWSDQRVIEAVAGDDPRAGALLYDRLIRVVEWTVVRVAGRRDGDHEDLIQASFEQILVTLRRGRYARQCSLTSWAAALSCHVALNALRAERQRGRLKRRSEHLAAARASLQATPLDPDRQLEARRRLALVREELARISPGRAEVLVLHEVNGLALGEIAMLLGISAAAAQSRLSRGRRELMQRLRAADLEEGS